MNIGILTFHMAHNYGAMLQAYALSKKINEIESVDCKVIDYRVQAIYRYHKKEGFKDLTKDQGKVIGTLKFVKRYICGYYSDKRWNAFNNFMLNDLPLSKPPIFNKDELKNLKYDVLVCGSDQIWNSEHTGGVDEGYFLDFADESTKKIAYAASKGPVEIEDNEKDYIKNALKDFCAIGVREYGLKESLEEIGIKSQWVLDPTLLMNKDEWLEIANYRKFEDYILIYKIKDDEKLYNVAKKLSKETGLQMVEISYGFRENTDDVIQLQDCGPREFVGLFSKAKYVVTNSFHGTCFSLIFNRKFYAVPYEGLSSRMDSLLKLVGLEDLRIYNENEFQIGKNIDYNKVNEIINNERQKSLKFLVDNIK